MPEPRRSRLAEELATAALFLNVVALLASVACLSTFVMGGALSALASGAVALVTFAASMTSLAVDARLRKEQVAPA